MLELDDIQSGVLRPRPTPYAATYVLFRIDDRDGGRELLARIAPLIASAAHPSSPSADTWVSVALTYPEIGHLCALSHRRPRRRTRAARQDRTADRICRAPEQSFRRHLGQRRADLPRDRPPMCSFASTTATADESCSPGSHR